VKIGMRSGAEETDDFMIPTSFCILALQASVDYDHKAICSQLSFVQIYSLSHPMLFLVDIIFLLIVTFYCSWIALSGHETDAECFIFGVSEVEHV
jgi:hypothetical protein